MLQRGTTINMAWSADLTNWTSVTNIPIANYSGGEIQSFDFFYDDNQLCVSFDDTFSVLPRATHQPSERQSFSNHHHKSPGKNHSGRRRGDASMMS